MLVPRYWAKTDGSATDPQGKRYRFELWGWSGESPGDALATARRRLAELAARVARGEGVGGRGAYLYGARPLREEIVRTLGEPGASSEAVVTRNRYGALVLNTAQVPFIDVDAPPTGGLSRLLGLFRRRPAGDEATLERIREACRRSGRHAFRVYRTKAGYRVLATSVLLDPRSSETQQLLAGFGADPAFAKLCQIQGSFRARLTPKPWRVGCSPPPGRHPREDAALEDAFAQWLSRYQAASERFATCRHLESIGSARAVPEARAVVDEHDRVSRARADLPLA